jgi:vacuolar-type H+-ATPase subunit H
VRKKMANNLDELAGKAAKEWEHAILDAKKRAKEILRQTEGLSISRAQGLLEDCARSLAAVEVEFDE